MILLTMVLCYQFPPISWNLGYKNNILKTKWMKRNERKHISEMGSFWKCKLLIPMRIWCPAFRPIYDTPRRYKWYISLSCQWNPRIIQYIWSFELSFPNWKDEHTTNIQFSDITLLLSGFIAFGYKFIPDPWGKMSEPPVWTVFLDRFSTDQSRLSQYQPHRNPHRAIFPHSEITKIKYVYI